MDLSAIKNYWFTWGQVAGIHNVLIARTGYCGEDGFEVYIPSDEATTVKMWEALMEAGAEFGIRPCGLGARNTLRLEAGMSLYGHEISEEINVLEAGLDRWLKLDKGEFIGRDALLAVQASGRAEAEDRGPGDGGARHCARWVLPCTISTGKQIGVVTSGSPAPFLKTNIAMALVPAECGRQRERCAGAVPGESGAGEAGADAVLQAGEEVDAARQFIDLSLQFTVSFRGC